MKPLHEYLSIHGILAYLLTVLCCMVCTSYIFLQPLGIDTATLLGIAKRVLSGEHLYHDMIMQQTPFSLYYYIIPVWISQLFNIEPVPAFLLFYFVVITTIASLCLYIASSNPAYRQPEKLYFLAVFIPLLLFIYCCFTTATDFSKKMFFWGIAFGQREHLFFILFAPYIFLTINKLHGITDGIRLRVFTGILGLLGCIIKPHFILMYLISELYLAISFKNWRIVLRTESLIILLGSPIAHLLAWAIFPEYFDSLAFFKASIMAQRISFVLQLTRSLLVYGLASFLMICVVWLLHRVKQSPIIAETRYLLVLIGTGFLLCFIQRTGFNYHGLPMYGCMFLLLMFVLLHFRKASTDQNYFMAVIFAAWFLLYYSQFLLALPEIADNHSVHQKQMADLRGRFHDKTFMILGTDLDPNTLTPYVGWKDISHTLSLQVVPYFYIDQNKISEKINAEKIETSPCAKVCTANCAFGIDLPPARYHMPATMPQDEKQYFDLAINDIVNKKPDLLLVEVTYGMWLFENLHFDFITYFNQDKRFQEAFKHYHIVTLPFFSAPPLFNDFVIYQKSM